MQLITAIQIYRNKFIQPKLFFSKQNFSIGSIIFIPQNKKEKPAIVLETSLLQEKKFLIRKNKIPIYKINNTLEIPLFKKEIIKIIQTAKEKTNYSTEEIFQKIISKKISKELNQLSPKKTEISNIKKNTDKLSIDIIRKKLTRNTKKKITPSRGLKTINSLLSQDEVTKKKTTLYSEKHYLTNEIRNYFGETAKKGRGSFGFYLGFFTRVPKYLIYEYWSEVKQTRKPLISQQKLFWWKIGQYLKNKNIDKQI